VSNRLINIHNSSGGLVQLIKRFHQFRRHWTLFLAGFILTLLLFIPVRLAIASYQAPQPQGILTLGGGVDREQFTAKFAQQHPSLDIWISSGSPPELVLNFFPQTIVNRLHLDYRAVDTVTNFTTLVTDFKQHHIQHIYLITSNFHLPRSQVIATLVLGSQGIIYTPVPVPSSYPQESTFRILRDAGRSLLWIFTGKTGASYRSNLTHLKQKTALTESVGKNSFDGVLLN
jgi:uncharacterized SAM-binding protein YcdF (DUF218 family)